MLERVSNILAKKMVFQTGKEEKYEEIYTYGFELMLSTMGGYVSIMLLSCLFGEMMSGLVFIVAFTALRLFSGGYHADTYGKCFLISNLLFLLTLLIRDAIVIWMPVEVYAIVAVMAGAYIVLRAPVIHKNQPLSERRQKMNRKLIRIVLLCELLWSIYLSRFNRELMAMVILCIVLTSALMLVADISDVKNI